MEHRKRCFSMVGSNLTLKLFTRPERIATDEHSSFRGRKKFSIVGPSSGQSITGPSAATSTPRSWKLCYCRICQAAEPNVPSGGNDIKLFAGNTKGESIAVPLTSCLTGLESAVRQLTFIVFICKTDSSKPVKQEVNGTVILPPLVFHAF
jgi:hypothetical protein